MTKDQINKRFAELAGVHWHIWRLETSDYGKHWECECGATIPDNITPPENLNPDFCTHPDLVLEEMMKREDWRRFQGELCIFPEVIPVDLIMNKTGQLALLAIRWMEEKKC